MDKLAFNAAESGHILGVSEWTIYKLVERGDLARIPHVGKRVLIARAELERFAAEGVKAAAS